MSYEIHFDHTKIDSTIFVRLGIKFDDSKEEEHFASLLKKEISRMISGTIKAAVSQEALDEFRMIKDAHAKKEWFEKNYPTYRQTQNEMFVQMVWACLTNTHLFKGATVIGNNINESVSLSSIEYAIIFATAIQENRIRWEINEEVLQLIKELTNPNDDAHLDEYMKKLASDSEEARLIKYADLIENTSSFCYSLHEPNIESPIQRAKDFYIPILTETPEVLAETSFEKYPKTAEALRLTLKVYKNLLFSRIELLESE